MTTYLLNDERTWTPVAVRGTMMEKAHVFAFEDVRSAFFRLPIDCQIPPHHHGTWVQVAVISGRMRVEQRGQSVRVIEAGGVYVVDGGENHTETAEVETVVLVTQAEDGSVDEGL